MHVPTCVCLCVFMHARTRTHTHTRTRARAHTHTHTHTHTTRAQFAHMLSRMHTQVMEHMSCGDIAHASMHTTHALGVQEAAALTGGDDQRLDLVLRLHDWHRVIPACADGTVTVTHVGWGGYVCTHARTRAHEGKGPRALLPFALRGLLHSTDTRAWAAGGVAAAAMLHIRRERCVRRGLGLSCGSMHTAMMLACQACPFRQE